MDMKIEEQKNLSNINNSMEAQRKEFQMMEFNLKNTLTEFDGVKASVSTLKEHFKGMENKIMDEIKLSNYEISKCHKHTVDVFEKLNNRQSELDEVLNERFQQLDVQKI